MPVPVFRSYAFLPAYNADTFFWKRIAVCKIIWIILVVILVTTFLILFAKD